ncbi:hypothetical protein [Bradyrhizobium sp. CCGE-LA001]|uniref:hypothetical protein n=1 Tax=Bradyrhizobium sp. CCGE-LA001 TaxID=1223566 RepID=UPI000745D382|nr:hypothetical protein [Bradyrhizobium sp. CCGE-LA001]AMA59957.1 hypothetical protein BCCGELA001_29375 [Bradyrhizobium sp. CCGE-LA001]
MTFCDQSQEQDTGQVEALTCVDGRHQAVGGASIGDDPPSIRAMKASRSLRRKAYRCLHLRPPNRGAIMPEEMSSCTTLPSTPRMALAAVKSTLFRRSFAIALTASPYEPEIHAETAHLLSDDAAFLGGFLQGVGAGQHRSIERDAAVEMEFSWACATNASDRISEKDRPPFALSQ